MADERNPLPMDVPDFVREAEEAMARGETFGQPLAEVTIKFGKGLVGEPLLRKAARSWWKSVSRIRIRPTPVPGNPL